MESPFPNVQGSPMFRVQTPLLSPPHQKKNTSLNPTLPCNVMIRFQISPSTSDNWILFGTWRNPFFWDKLIPPLIWILCNWYKNTPTIGFMTVSRKLSTPSFCFGFCFGFGLCFRLGGNRPEKTTCTPSCTLKGKQRAWDELIVSEMSSLKLWCLLWGQPHIEENTFVVVLRTTLVRVYLKKQQKMCVSTWKFHLCSPLGGDIQLPLCNEQTEIHDQ